MQIWLGINKAQVSMFLEKQCGTVYNKILK